MLPTLSNLPVYEIAIKITTINVSTPSSIGTKTRKHVYFLSVHCCTLLACVVVNLALHVIIVYTGVH